MKRCILRWVTRALDVDSEDPKTARGLARIFVSGALAVAIGVSIAARGYVRAGFRWPRARTK